MLSWNSVISPVPPARDVSNTAPSVRDIGISKSWSSVTQIPLPSRSARSARRNLLGLMSRSLQHRIRAFRRRLSAQMETSCLHLRQTSSWPTAPIATPLLLSRGRCFNTGHHTQFPSSSMSIPISISSRIYTAAAMLMDLSFGPLISFPVPM